MVPRDRRPVGRSIHTPHIAHLPLRRIIIESDPEPRIRFRRRPAHDDSPRPRPGSRPCARCRSNQTTGRVRTRGPFPCPSGSVRSKRSLDSPLQEHKQQSGYEGESAFCSRLTEPSAGSTGNSAASTRPEADVLSFPAEAMIPSAERIAGDLAISVPTARRQSAACGQSLGTELKVLMLHGLLHLAGYDHEVDSGKMARRERALRAKLGLPQGLIERVQAKSAHRTARLRS